MEDRKALFRQRITRFSEKFTASDKRIADSLLRNYPKCLLKNATEIAGEVGVNVSTVTRFFQKIGYKNIREAHVEFREDVDFIISSPLDRISRVTTASHHDAFSGIVDLDIQNIHNTVEALKEGQLQQLVHLLSQKTRAVFLFAERSKPLCLAYYLYVQLKLVRSAVQLLDTDKSVITHALVDAGEQDILILFDFRRYCKINQEIVETFRRIGGNVVVFTDSPLSPNAQNADMVFLIDTKNPSMFDSYTAGFTLINLIIAELAETLPAEIREKYSRLEQIYSDLDIFS